MESAYPYNLNNLTNVSEVMASYTENGVNLSVSGHLHPGSPLTFADSVGYVIGPALCEAPFRFLCIQVHGHGCTLREEALRMSKEPPHLNVLRQAGAGEHLEEVLLSLYVPLSFGIPN